MPGDPRGLDQAHHPLRSAPEKSQFLRPRAQDLVLCLWVRPRIEISGNLTLPEVRHYFVSASHIDADVGGRDERPVADTLFSRRIGEAVAVMHWIKGYHLVALLPRPDLAHLLQVNRCPSLCVSASVEP